MHPESRDFAGSVAPLEPQRVLQQRGDVMKPLSRGVRHSLPTSVGSAERGSPTLEHVAQMRSAMRRGGEARARRAGEPHFHARPACCSLVPVAQVPRLSLFAAGKQAPALVLAGADESVRQRALTPLRSLLPLVALPAARSFVLARRSGCFGLETLRNSLQSNLESVHLVDGLSMSHLVTSFHCPTQSGTLQAVTGLLNAVVLTCRVLRALRALCLSLGGFC